MKKYILILALCLCTTFQALAWGQLGHDVAAYIAEKNLTKKANKAVKAALDSHSLVYYSSWLDSASNTDEYRYTKTWHYRNVDKGFTAETMPLNENGDVVRAVEQLTIDLKSGELNDAEEKVALMMLIHLVGDLHCPMHAGRLSDLGGNRRTVYFFGRKTNLHSIWDTAMLEASHKWSHSEWWEQLDIIDKQSKLAIQQGTPLEWFSECVSQAAYIYESTPEEAQLSYDYITEFAPVVERQLLNAGLRLAAILNEIYG